MTAAEKAKELVQKFAEHSDWSSSNKKAKKCAHVAVDAIIQLLDTLHKPEYTAFAAKQLFTVSDSEYDTHLHGYELIAYWQDVKKQINRL